jgi:alanine-glyoxylate transaminase/serine-glyoxylate transaminase/serine-pyruvate transaminase
VSGEASHYLTVLAVSNPLPRRLLLGPGPSEVSAGVLAALAEPTIGHLDPEFLQRLDNVQEQLRRVFQTRNPMTIPISGTGSAGMEACFANLVEDGDEVVVGVNGVFGTRMAEVATRLGAKVVTAEAEWGSVLDAKSVAAALAKCKRPRVVALVHAETSTGAWQPVPDIAKLARDAGALLLLDTVTSLGGCPVQIDEWGVDACYSGTQKCLSCPPGLSPLTFSEAAMARVRERVAKCRSWYLDVTLIGGYFGSSRVYHHTAPINMIFALEAALRAVLDEGLDARFERHRANHLALMAGLATLGIESAAQAGHQLWMLNSVRVPRAVDEKEIRIRLLARHGIEIGAGLGPLAGKVWRVGLMGESSRIENVRRFLGALAIELGSDTGRLAVEEADAAYRTIVGSTH